MSVNATHALKAKFHDCGFLATLPATNVAGKSPTRYEEVSDLQTVSACQAGLECR